MVLYYNHNQNIKKIDESTERNHSNQVTSSILYRKSGGLTIPLFFFRDFYIDNDIDFALNFNWDTDIKLIATSVVEDLTDFNEQTNNTSWSLKPNVIVMTKGKIRKTGKIADIFSDDELLNQTCLMRPQLLDLWMKLNIKREPPADITKAADIIRRISGS